MKRKRVQCDMKYAGEVHPSRVYELAWVA